MVKVPTSRDVQRVSARSGRNSMPSTFVNPGEGLQNLGRGMQQAAFNMMDLADIAAKDARNKQGFDLNEKILRFRNEEEKRFNEAKMNASESGVGFTKGFMEGYMQRSDAFVKEHFEGVPDEKAQPLRSSLIGLGNSLYQKAYSHEGVVKNTFYDLKTNDGLGGLRTQIQNNSAPFGELYEQGLALIDQAPQDSVWKMKRRAAWKEDSSIAKFKWEFAQDPEGAVKDLRTGGDYFAAVRMAESGNNPNAKNPMPGQTASGLYQFTDGTWSDLIKKYPELGLTKEGKNDPEQQEKAMRAFTSDNAKVLSNAGIEATNANLYMAHFFGAQGAVNVLGHSDDTPMSEIVSPNTIKVNPILRGKTVGDVKAWTAKKVGSKYDYSAIAPETKEKLVAWAEKEEGQRQSAQKAAMSQKSDDIELQIVTDPTSVSEKDILEDEMLTTAAQTSLNKALRTEMKKQKERTEAPIWLGNGERGNPLDSDDRKMADLAYKGMLEADGKMTPQQAGEGVVKEKGVVPKEYANHIRNALNSTNAADLANGAALAYRVQQSDMQALRGVENSGDLMDAATKYGYFRNEVGLSHDQVGQKLLSLADPEARAQREALLKSPTVKDKLKAVDRSFVENQMSKGSGNIFDYSLGINDAAGDAMTARYRAMYQEAIVEANGDFDLASELATKRFQRSYGPSQFIPQGDDVVIPYPPEKTYQPTPDGKHDYIADQLKEALTEEVGDYEKAFLLPLGTETEKAAKAGIKVPYLVQYVKDGKELYHQHPFYADYQTGLEAFKNDPERSAAAYVEQVKKPNFEVPTDQPEGAEMLGAEFGRKLQSRDEEMRKATQAYRGE